MKIQLRLKLLLLAWTVGLVGRFVLFLFQVVGLVRIEGTQNLKKLLSEDKGFLVIHRHPSMRETVIIPLSFFPQFLWNPWKMPLSAPDKHNFYDPWWCWFARPLAIPVPRGNTMGELRALYQMSRAIEEGRALVLAPEGGRTFKGEEFKHRLPCGDIKIFPAPDEGVNISLHVIRRFQNGVKLLCRNGTPVLPVWVDSTKWHMRIVFGESVIIPHGENAVETLENILLNVA